MRIQCPDCSAHYEVPDDRLAAGRTVRCARCGRDWMPVAPAPAPHDVFLQSALDASESEPADDYGEEEAVEPAPPAAPAITPVRAPVGTSAADAPARPVRRRRLALGAAWAASLLVLAAAAWAAVAFRAPIAAAWPPSLRIYAALNLPVTSGH